MEYYRDVVCVGLKDGTITDCKLQVKYELQPKYTYNGKTILPINYVADFVITYSNNSVIIWDVKGLADSTAKLKRKMFYYKYPDLDYRWVVYSAIDGGWKDYDEVQKARAKRKKLKNK